MMIKKIIDFSFFKLRDPKRNISLKTRYPKFETISLLSPTAPVRGKKRWNVSFNEFEQISSLTLVTPH